MDADRAAALVARERTRIEQQLTELERPQGEELSDADQHPGDVGTELFEEERDRGLAERLREELEALERAELRIEGGTYGVSVESGEPIPDERLEAVPWAERTTEEQERLEGSG